MAFSMENGKMILPVQHAMTDRITLELATPLAEYLVAEAAHCGITESELASLALSLFCHYRDRSQSGDAVLLCPSELGQSADLSLTAVTVERRRLAATLPLLVDAVAYEFATRRSGDRSPLHLVSRPSDE